MPFLRSIGEDIAGIIPPNVRQLCAKQNRELPVISIFEPKKMNHFIALFTEYFEKLNICVKSEFDKLKKMEKHNRFIYQQRGEIHEERRSALLDQQSKVRQLKEFAISFGELLNLETVHLPEDSKEDKEMSIDIYHPERGIENCEMDDCWEDEDQRLFYTCLPDLKSLVPMNAWKDSEKERGGKHIAKKSGGKEKGKRKADQDIQEEIAAGLSELYGDDDFDDDHLEDEKEDNDPKELSGLELKYRLFQKF